MALRIPDTNSRGDNSPAFRQTNPAESLGNKISTPINYQAVPQDIGGAIIQNEHLFRGGQALTEAFQSVVSDIDKKEKALNRGNELYDIRLKKEQAVIDLEAKKEELLKAQATEGFDEDELAKRYSASATEISAKHFGETNYREQDIQSDARLTNKTFVFDTTRKFKADTIIPQKADRILTQANDLARKFVHSIGVSPTVENLQSLTAAVDDLYKDPAIRASLTPGQLQKAREQTKFELGKGLITGQDRQVAEFETNNPNMPYIDRQNRKQQMLKSNIETTNALFEAGVLTLNADDFNKWQTRQTQIVSDIENDKIRYTEQQASKAEAAQSKFEREETARLRLEIKRSNGVYPDEAISRSKLPPDIQLTLREERDEQLVKEETRVQTVVTYRGYISNGTRFSNPTAEDKKGLDTVYTADNKVWQTLPPEEQMYRRAEFVVKSGYLPDLMARDLNAQLDNPKTAQLAMAQLKVIKEGNAALPDHQKGQYIKGLSEKAQDIYYNIEVGGMGHADAVKNAADVASRKGTVEDKIVNSKTFAKFNVKGEAEYQEKMFKVLGDAMKDEYDTWRPFDRPKEAEIPAQMVSTFAEAVKSSVGAGMDEDVAVKKAFTDIMAKSKFGVSEVGGQKRVMMFAPEVVSGLKTETIEADLRTMVGPTVTQDEDIGLIPLSNFTTPGSEHFGKYEVYVVRDGVKQKLYDPQYPNQLFIYSLPEKKQTPKPQERTGTIKNGK